MDRIKQAYHLQQLHYKNTLLVIGDYLAATGLSIRQIQLINFQQRVWSNIDPATISWTKKVEQDTIVQQTKPKTYWGKLTRAQEMGYYD